MSQIIGDKELQAKLNRLSDLNFLKRKMEVVARHVKGKVSKYPPATGANSSANQRWYERGWGSKWRRADGSIGGRQTSEDLGPSWTGKAETNTRAIIGNDTSYAKWVQGGDTQARALKAIGWKTTDTVVEEESEAVLKHIQKAVDNELRK